MRSLITITIAAAASLVACGGTTASGLGVEAPSYMRSALGGDCDVAAAIDVGAADSDAEKLLGTLRKSGAQAKSELAPYDGLRRIEACARTRGGTVERWAVVFRAKEGASSPSARTFVDLVHEGVQVLLDDRTLVVSKGAEPLARGDVGEGFVLPRGTFAWATIRGAAAERVSSEWGSSREAGLLAMDLVEAALDLRITGTRLELVLRARYTGSAGASRAAGALPAMWDAAMHSGRDSSANLKRLLEILTLEVSHDGSEATAIFAVPTTEEGIRAIASRPVGKPTPHAPAEAYGGHCAKGQRFDLDRRTCVDNP